MNPASSLPQSVQARLVKLAHARMVDPNLILVRYASERLLYRLSRSKHAKQFVLKGGMLLVAWLGDMIRPTRDVDLLGFGDLTEESLVRTFAEVATVEVEPDGVAFDPGSITVSQIRDQDAYGGLRLVLLGALGTARLRVQVDVGIGDAVTPEPQSIEYPSLLDFPPPIIRGYPRETAIAEKLHAMVVLGSKNSRMRDFFDVRELARYEPFEGARLVRAIRATFDRRRTTVPDTALALTPAFAAMAGKDEQWRAFLRKNAFPEEDLATTIESVAAFLAPPLENAADGRSFDKVWFPGGPWS